MATYNGNCGVDGGSNITWSLDTDSGSLVLTGSGEMENYLGNDTPWYTYSSYITNLTVGDGITSIGAYAFAGLNKLTNVTLSNSVTSIGTEAFSGCVLLNSITIPNGVTSIGREAFLGCRLLNSITIPNSVTSIETGAFDYCLNLAEIIVDDNNATYCSVDGVLFNKDRTTLIQYALGKTSTTYTIPEGTINIQGRAFAGSSALTSVVIPNSMTIINNSAFSDCSITSIAIPNSVIKIEESAFEYSNLTEIRIPSSVKEVGSSAFKDCSKLTTVVIEEGLTSISSYMFKSCHELRNVTIPETITEIGTLAFQRCSSLNNIILPNSLVTIDDSAFSETAGLTNISIPDNVTSIGNMAFTYCTALSKATLGKNVSTIGTSIFDNCSSLKELEINGDIETLSLNSLGTAVAIEKITLGEEVTKLTSNMLANYSSLNSFICKSTIIDVESGAFEGTGLIVEDETTQYIINSYTNKKWLISYVLSTVINIPKDIELICSNALHTSSGNLKIVLPRSVNTVNKNSLVIDSSNAEIMFIFENNEVFLSSSGIVDITANTEAIIKLGFYYNMTNEQNLIALSNYAQAHGYETVFFYSNADEKITIVKFKNTNNIDCITEFVNKDSDCKISFNNIKTAIINEEAFCNRTDIKSLVIPITISQIKKGAFKGCTNINSITIPYIGGSKSGIIDSIDCAYFTWIFGLDKIEGATGTNITSGLPKSVIVNSDITRIPANAFNRCYIIKNIELPITITSIGDYAFYYTGATIFNIPKYLKVIGNYAFYSTDLTNVNWNTTLSCNEEDKQVGTNCFYMTSSAPKVNGYKFVDLNGDRFLCDEGDSNYTFDYNNGTVSKDSSVVAYFSLAYYVFTRFSTPAQNSNFAENSGKCGDNLEWYLNEENDGSYTLYITGAGKMTNYSTSVRPGWEGKKSLIKNINISDNCTSIGDYAFYKYENIISINFPVNLVTIGQYAFSYCYSLTGDIVFNRNLKTIGLYAFYNCSNIISFEFNKGLTTINQAAFMGCIKVTEINIPTTVTLIEFGAFGNMEALEKATLPFVGASATATDTKSVLGYVFASNNSSSSLYYTGRQICETGNSSNPINTILRTFPISLKEIHILGGKVATGAFSGLKYIEKVIIDDNVTSIGTNIFWGMENLKEIKLPYINSSSNQSYYYNNNSYNIISGSSKGRFNFIEKLFNVSPYKQENGPYVNEDKLKVVTLQVRNRNYGGDLAYLQIPLLEKITITNANLSDVANSANYESFSCWKCDGLNFELNLPNNMETTIPYDCFYLCNISSLNFNVNPTVFESECFYNSLIENINNATEEILHNATTIGRNAFYGSPLQDLIVASSYSRAGAPKRIVAKATTNISQRVMKLLANKDYAWKALLYGSNYDVYITDNNTYADGSSYLPTLYLPNNSKMKVGQQISLIGENTYKIANLEPFSCTNKIFYRQSKGILSGKLSYFNTTSGLVKYDDILRQWVIEEDSFKASLTSTPVNFTIGTTYDSNNIDGTIRIEDDIVYIENTGTTIEKADTITIEKAKVTEGSIDAELVNVVTENTKFTSNVDSQIQEIVSKNYYNITFSPGFYVSSNGYNTVTITIADKELILSDDLLTNTVLLSVDTKGTITLEGNTGENIKRGIISESLIGIIKKGETGFVLNDTHYIITDVNRSNNQIVFEDENNNGFIIQKIGEFKYDIALENYIDLASSDFNKTDLHLTLNYINIYEVSDIEPYTHLSNNVLRDGEILYLVTTTEVINPTNFEVTERSLEKEFSLERYTTLATVEGLEGESLQHILVYPDTFYEINSNYIETPQYYFQTSEKQDTIFYVNETEVSENASGIYEKTINSCSAKIEGEYKGDLIWYKWTIQEDIDGDYYTIDEFTEYYNPNIILNYDLFRNNTNYRLMLTIKTKENLEVESYLYISVEYGEDLLNGVTIDKDCIKKAIKIDFSQVREQKNIFDFDKFVTAGGYTGIQYVHIEDSDEKIYEYIGEEEYLYYNVYIPYNNNYVFSYKTNKVGVTSIRFYDKNKNNISSTIIDIIKDGFYDAEQDAITQTTTELIIPYIEGTNVAYFQVGFKVWQDGYFSELQLEVGTEATEYQPNNSSVDRKIERYIILREEANNDESLCKIAEIDSNVTYFYDYSFNREETYQYYVMPIFRNVVSGEEERGVPHKLNNQITYNLKEITLIDTKIELTIEDNYDLINDYEANIDEYSIWHLKYNTDAKNIEVVTDKAIYETSMKIPVVNKTARNYKTGTIKAFIGSFIKENDRLTYRDSIKLQNKFQEFCDNGRVKMLRDEIGNVLPVDITLQSFEYNPHTIPTNITVIFKWSQVGEEKNLSVWSKE